MRLSASSLGNLAMLEFVLALLLLPILFTQAAAAEQPISAGTELHYKGAIERRTDDGPAKSRKTFEVTFLVSKAGAEGAEVCWLLEERGRGEWPWFERFGRLALDPQWRTRERGPALLYDRGEARSVVPLAIPLLTTEKALAAGGGWQEDKLEFSVEKSDKLGEREVWRISVRDPYGTKSLLHLDRESPLVVSRLDRVMLGRGEEYQMNCELLGVARLPEEKAAETARAFEALIALRAKLNLPAQTQEAEWKPDQLALLTAGLPQLQKAAAGTGLEKIASAAARDVELQSGRHTALSELSSKHVGRAVEKFAVKGPSGESLSSDDLQGKVTVLHFWEYRDEPLEEPYGQIGYLDFLYQHRKAAGVQVYGVAVDGRLADEKTRGAAERSVKKLKGFMNLSYPIVLDSGGLVKQFGDPRLLGANLPLFVVIGRDGKIAHYHVGHHKVHQEQGLTDLDRVVGETLDKK